MMWEVKTLDPRHQRRKRILLTVLLLSLPLLVLGAYWKGGEDSRERIRELEALEEHYEQVSRELEQSQQMQAVLSSGERLGRQANEQSRQTIKLLEEQIYKLQQDLAFYKGVLAPASRREGLRIRSFELQSTDDPLLYRYKLLLSRVGTDDKPLEGRCASAWSANARAQRWSWTLPNFPRSGPAPHPSPSATCKPSRKVHGMPS